MTKKKFFDLDKIEPSQIALLNEDNRQITYGELISVSDDLHDKLEEKSIILILCSNKIGVLAGYVHCMLNNLVPFMVDEDLSLELINNLIDCYSPPYVLLSKDRMGDFIEYAPVFEYMDYVILKTNYKRILLNEDIALLMSTSGSTGSSKLVCISGHNLLYNTESIADTISVNKRNRLITTLPLNFSYGLSLFHAHLLKGSMVLVTERKVTDRKFWEFFKIYKATYMGGVPFHYQQLLRIGFLDMNLPDLRGMSVCGGFTPFDIQKIFGKYAQENKKEFMIIYGQTEATMGISVLKGSELLNRPGSVGIPMKGIQLSIVDGGNHEVNKGDRGEIVVYGPTVTLGYAQKKEDLKKNGDFKGLLHTGDIGYQDADGYFYLSGRKQRFIKLQGKRFSLDEIESLLKQKVSQEIACTGSDEHLVVHLEAEEKLGEVLSYLQKGLKINKSQIEIRKIDVIPRNKAGKTLYSLLNEVLVKEEA